MMEPESDEFLAEVDRIEQEALLKRHRTEEAVYAVARGKSIGLFTKWAECQEAIKGYPLSLQHKFRTRSEAEMWLADCAEEDQKAGMLQGATIVFIDGACQEKRGGIGIWYSANDPRNRFKKMEGEQTNQRAELWAFIRLLQIEPNLPLHVFSDSGYCVSGVKYSMKLWKRQGWPPKNTDLWKRIDALLVEREHMVVLEHVKGHSGAAGNEGAHALATAACNE